MKLHKDIIYNLLFVCILAVYSVEVCPHVSKLGFLITMISFFCVIGPLFIVKRSITKRSNSKLHVFLVNFIYFGIIGIAVGLFNFIFRSFPIESAFKMMTGAFYLGALTAVICILEEPFKETQKRISFINRVSLFLLLSLALIGTIWILLMKENLSVFDAVQHGSMIDLVKSVILETFFVLAIIVAYFVRIVQLYKRMLKAGIESQISSLNEVRRDNLEVTLPRFSNDEFSIIGDEVNAMIGRLRTGEKIKSGFEKVTGHDSDSEFLEKITHSDFSSEQKEMTILFSDIKGFTNLCEESDPVEFVKALNTHFESMVQVVKKFDGHINKFIGDAILVYFEGDDSCERAVHAAMRMIDSTQFNIGIGIHHGTLLAGLLGSSERLEYSIIGSVVNKSARLESATRGLNADVVISSAAAAELTDAILEGFQQASLELKGFENKETVYYK